MTLSPELDDYRLAIHSFSHLYGLPVRRRVRRARRR